MKSVSNRAMTIVSFDSEFAFYRYLAKERRPWHTIQK